MPPSSINTKSASPLSVVVVGASELPVVRMVLPSIVTTPALDLAIVVSLACPNSILAPVVTSPVNSLVPATFKLVLFNS